MKDHQCLDCKFYDELDDQMGLCKRYPPTLAFNDKCASIEDECDQTVFPVVNETCWCGEYKGKYTKQTNEQIIYC